MRLTSKSEYTLLGLIYLARHQDEGFIKIATVCSEYGISQKYLEQLFSALKQNRIINTKKGSNGGYALSRPANKINIAQIIRIMDGPLAPTESVSKYFYSHTPLEKEKKILVVLKNIRDYISNTLEHLTLSDLI